MRLLILPLLLLSALGAAEATPLPAGADKVYKAYVAQLTKSYLAETDKVRAALKREQEVATKKGDLDAAMAVKGLLAKIEGGQGLEDARAGAKEDGDLLTTKAADTPKPVAPSAIPKEGLADPVDAGRAVVGVWAISGAWVGTHTVNADGSVLCSNGNVGAWSIADGAIVLSWPGGAADRFRLPLKRVMVGVGPNGMLTWTKTK